MPLFAAVNPSFIPCSAPPERNFLARLLSPLDQCIHQFDNDLFKQEALKVIPVAKICESAKQQFSSQEDGRLGYDDFVVKALLHWFKHEFFKWVNEPACMHCASSTKLIGGAHPTSMEQAAFAGRVEVYQCNTCPGITRFPRYNHALKLLETRCGRCGEWAQAFTLCCTAMGFQARYVLDWTDHVWTEVYSKHLGRWVHCDSCENSFDGALTYEAGWGKKLTYVIGFSADGVVDVTQRYTRKWGEVAARRNEVSESWLKRTVELINSQLDIYKSQDRLKMVLMQRIAENKELLSFGLGAQELKLEELQGRISGAQEWKESRGETGSQINKLAHLKELIKFDNQAAKSQLDKMKTVFSFPTFENCQQSLSFVSHAQITNQVIRLTSATNDQQGAVWFPTPITVGSNFCCRFQFSVKTTGEGADGFAFVMQKESNKAIGQGGGYLGYAGIKNGLAIEFDTYRNYDINKDPDNNHIAIMSSLSSPLSSDHDKALACTPVLPFRIADGNVHIAQILCINKILYVFVDDLEKPFLSCKFPESNTNIDDISNSFFIGFTAATGGLNQEHCILSWSFSTNSQLFPCTRYSNFTSVNFQGIEKKMHQFNVKQGKGKLSDEELMLCKDWLLDNKDGLSEKQHVIKSKLMQWDASCLFPVLDVLRIVVLRSTVAKAMNEAELCQLMDNVKSTPSYANQVMFCRLLSNMFQHGEVLMFQIQDKVFEFILWLTAQDSNKEINSNLKLAHSAVLHNYAALLYKKFKQAEPEVSTSELLLSPVSALSELFKREVCQTTTADSGTVLNLLLALGTLLSIEESETDLKDLVKVLEVESDLDKVISSSLEERTREAAVQVKALL